MRLIRSVIRPAYTTSFHKLQELKTSNETLNHVLFRMDHGSSLQCVRRRSCKAASVPSDETLERRKIGKRIPRNERKSMVESYVNKYREMHAGKFPTISDTNKNVGGSYYVIKDILEELKYSSKMLHSDKMDATLSPNNAGSMSISQKTNVEEPSSVQTKNDEGLSNFQKSSEVLAIKELNSGDSSSKGEWTLSTTQVVVDGSTSKAQTLNSISESPQSNKGQQSPILANENYEAKLTVSDMPKDAETQSHQFVEQQPTARQLQSDDTSERELDKVPAEHAPEKKSSVWQSLKSLTSGFFDMWRR